MIKLCIVATIPTAIRIFFGHQTRFLREHGYDITVITSTMAADLNLGEEIDKSVKVYMIQMSRTIKPMEDFFALCKIFAIIRKGKFDIVQYVTPKGALFGSIASWIARVPVRLYLMWGLYYVTQTGFRRFFFKTIEKIICRCSTAIAPDSKDNVKLAIEEGLCKANKIGVVGSGSANGVNTTRFDPDRLFPFRDELRKKHNIPLDAFVFGTIAAIVRDKGINELISAFVEVAKNYPKAYLLYIGQTAEKDPVNPETLKLIENHKCIIHIDWQTEPEKYMAAMDVFILPTYREGFGVVNIEASAMRLPVISTNVPGPQESIVNGETGILVPAREIAPLIDAMKTLLENHTYLKKLGDAGRKRIQELYEQQKLWNAILKHRNALLLNTGKYVEMNGQINRK